MTNKMKTLWLLGSFLLQASFCKAFVPSSSSLSSTSFSSSTNNRDRRLQMVHNLRDADFFEMMVGGERYEMVPLPDSMLDTTLFVGNLNEFAHDDDLSSTFSQVTNLISVPACVVRKPNMDSLSYGFVTYPSREEKDKAIMRFHGSTFMGKTIKVEEIRDHPKKGRVRVPERMVAYVLGNVKNLSGNQVNTMRRVAPRQGKLAPKPNTKRRRQTKSKNETFKLTTKERDEFRRAIRSGFITLNGTGFRRGRKTSNLACAHRQYCDTELSKPQIVLCKASGGRPLDCVIVDLSPVRSTVETTTTTMEDYMTQIQTAAQEAGMELRLDYIQDNIESTENKARGKKESLPISKVPVISMGVFEGERAKAKAMARELASLWELPQIKNEIEDGCFASDTYEKNNKTMQRNNKQDNKRKKRRNNNRRDQKLDRFF